MSTKRNNMDLFVYNWAYNGHTVYGHCLNKNGKYVCIRCEDFYPSCYVEGDTVPRSAVVPRAAEFKRMFSSRDVSRLCPFYRLYFNSASDLTSFSQEHSYKCYMADIPQVATFLSHIKADHVGWVRVDNCAAAFRMKDITSVFDMIPPITPRVMAFDIEVRSSDSGMPQPYRLKDTVEMVSVVMFGGNFPVKKYILHTLRRQLCIDGVIDVMFDDEIGLITGFFDLMKELDPTVVTGFNIYGFDMHYMVSRLKLRLVEIPHAYRGTTGTVDVIKVDWSSDAYGHNSYDRLVIGGRVIIDMYLYFRRMKLDKYSLNFVSEKFVGEKKDDMSYEKMARAFASGGHADLRTVAQYCVRDSVLVMKLFEKVQMWIDVCEISKITRCGIEDIYTRGEQMKMISQCVAECEKRNIVLQPQQRSSDWKQYEGAYVLEPTKGVYDGCSIVDFQSLYPSIIIAYNICPSTYAKTGGTIRIGDHGFRAKPIGLLPGMIKRILEERKQVKTQMTEIAKDSIEYIVLDRRQNALKICANSVYGMMGFQSSRYFGHLGCAESVTTAGRLLLSETVDKINSSYPVKVVYGDSVTGYTPTIVRIDKRFIYLETFENLATEWGNDRWIRREQKETCELHNVEVWTDGGWTKLHRIIRHVLAPHKKIIRIITHAGMVDVTDEHSLLDVYGKPVDAACVQIGDELMHCSYPILENNISPRKDIMSIILNSSIEARQAFWDAQHQHPQHQVTIAFFALLASSLGYNTTDGCAVKNICNNIEYTGYVYDATTDNGHFQAGPGRMIVHNTDSCMLWHDDKDKKTCRIHVAKRICDEITASLPDPMALQFEAYCDKVILLTKKRYILIKDDHVSYKGVMNARRDYCKYAKDTYSKTLELVAKGTDHDEISNYVDMRILRLLYGKVETSELVVTKSINKKLSAYKVNQPHVVLAKRLVTKTGIDIPAGTRLDYIYVKDADVRIVTPEELNAGNFEIDGKFYVEKQLATQIDDVLSAIGMGYYVKQEWLATQNISVGSTPVMMDS